MKNRNAWCGGVLAVLVAVAAWAAGVDGKWRAEYTSPDGQARRATFVFRGEGEKLTGTGEAPIQDGKVSGNQISFAVMRNFGGEDVKFNVTVAAMDRTFEMTAKRIN